MFKVKLGEHRMILVSHLNPCFASKALVEAVFAIHTTMPLPDKRSLAVTHTA